MSRPFKAWTTGASAFCDRGRQLFHEQGCNDRFCPSHRQSKVHPHVAVPGLGCHHRRDNDVGVYGSNLNPTMVTFSSMCHMQHDASVRPFMAAWSQTAFRFLPWTADGRFTTGGYQLLCLVLEDCASIACRTVNSSTLVCADA